MDFPLFYSHLKLKVRISKYGFENNSLMLVFFKPTALLLESKKKSEKNWRAGKAGIIFYFGNKYITMVVLLIKLINGAEKSNQNHTHGIHKNPGNQTFLEIIFVAPNSHLFIPPRMRIPVLFCFVLS